MPGPLRNLLLVVILLVVAPSSFASQRLDIFQVLGQFVQASHAANRCLHPEPETLSRFHANFAIVSARATEEMLRQQPGSSEEQVSLLFRNGAEAVQRRIDEVVSAKGCSAPSIEDLLRRFEVQVKLEL